MIITIYEQNFIDERIKEKNIEDFLAANFKHYEKFGDSKNTIEYFKYIYDEYGIDDLFRKLTVLLDKSILELCYEIKPITVERLNKITIEQWEKWAEKNGLYITTLQLPDVKNEAHLLCEKHGGFVLIEYIISDDHQDKTFIDLLSLINITFDKHDLCNMNKAIHDLVWELETI